MSLKSDLYDVFKNMQDDDDFAEGIGNAIKDYAEGLSFSTVPATLAGADTSPSGTFADGSATISWTLTGSKITDKIKAVCTEDMTDDDLAGAIADGLDADAPVWSVTISGTTTLPNGATSPSSDSGSVTSTFVSATVKSAMQSAFDTMYGMTDEGDDGDDVFADELAKAVKNYYTGSVNNGMGASHLAGVQFVIQVSE